MAEKFKSVKQISSLTDANFVNICRDPDKELELSQELIFSSVAVSSSCWKDKRVAGDLRRHFLLLYKRMFSCMCIR